MKIANRKAIFIMLKMIFNSLCVICLLSQVLLADGEYTFERYTMPGSRESIVGVKYRSGDTASSVPLGGLGTGTFYLTSRGTFEGNALMNTYRPIPGLMNGCFFTIRTGKGSRVLQTQPVGGIPSVDSLTYLGHFPVVDIDYKTGLELGVHLKAMSPFILGDSKTSGTPGTIFRFRLTNPSSSPVNASLAYSWLLTQPEGGVKSSGDSDGYLTCDGGRLAPGEARSIPVIYAVARSRDEMNGFLQSLRSALSVPDFPLLNSDVKPSPYNDQPLIILKNDVTDFSIDPAGAFNHEDYASSACMRLDGVPTLSQYSFRVFYKSETDHNAGISVDLPRANRLQELELIQPTQTGSDGAAYTELRTIDKCLTIQIKSQLTDKTAAIRWFRITNTSDKPITNIRLAIYSNPFLSTNPNDDAGILDSGTESFMVNASDSTKVAVLTGADVPANGWTSTWGHTLRDIEADKSIEWRNIGSLLKRKNMTAGVRRSSDMVSVTRSDKSSANEWTIGVIPGDNQRILTCPRSSYASNGSANFWKLYGRKAGDDNSTVVSSEITVPAHGSRDVTFILAWYYPDASDSDNKPVGHQYANWYKSSRSVADYLSKSYKNIESDIAAWQSKVYNADLPDYLKDQLVNSLYALARNSAWINDWRFSLSESFTGCPITETIVCRFYGSIPLAWFYPDLERNTMRQFAKQQRSDGAIPFCFGGSERWDSPNYDVQKILNSTEFILMVWRDYYYWKDKSWAEEMLPAVQKALAYVRTLDTDGDWLINDDLSRQYYDCWQFHGASAYTSSIQLAALRAAEELAEVTGNMGLADECRIWFEKAQNRFQELLWTGEFYRLYNDPVSGAKSDTCLSNQLVGQWYAYECGLGEILPKERIDSALEHIAEMNGSLTSYGLVNGVTSLGEPDMASGTFNHSNFQTIGETYCYTATCIYAGKKDSGLKYLHRLVDNIALRQKRSWNTTWSMDPSTGACAWGEEYYSNMCIWGLYSALTGKYSLD